MMMKRNQQLLKKDIFWGWKNDFKTDPSIQSSKGKTIQIKRENWYKKLECAM